MNTVATEMIKYYAGDKKRINHFIKVHGYAKAIGEAEELDERTMLILETAAYVHDIGIRFFRIAVVLLHGHEDQVVLVCLEVVASIGRNRPFTAIRQQLFLQPIGVLAPCVGLVAVLQLKKHNAGREEMLLRPVVPIVIIHLALIGVRNGAILILRLVAQRLFRLAYKVGGDHNVHRQHEKGKEQQCRTEDQIHDPQLDVFHVRSAPFSL